MRCGIVVTKAYQNMDLKKQKSAHLFVLVRSRLKEGQFECTPSIVVNPDFPPP